VSRRTKFIISLVVSGGALYYAFRGEDFAALADRISQVRMGYLLAGIGVLVFSVLVRAKRWQLILLPMEHIRVHPLFGVTMIGYFGNTVLPFRLGEILRAYSLSSVSQITVSRAFGTIILERVIDMLGAIVLMLVFIPLFPFEDSSVPLFALLFSAMTFVGVVVLIGLGYARQNWFERLHEKPFFRRKAGSFILNLLDKLIDGLTALRNTRHAFSIIGYTLFLWVIYYLLTYCFLQAVDVHIGNVGVGIVLITTTLALAIPALPGFVGTYDVVAKATLTALFAIRGDHALAYAIVSHAASIIPYLVIGAVYFVLSSVHIRDIKKTPLNS